MLIIARTFWFINMTVVALIIAAIVLMIIRLIVDAADLNPFGAIARTTRRFTDSFVMPVRGSLRGFGVDPKYAPVVIILLTILLGYFLLQLVGTVGETIAGVILSVRAGSVIYALGYVLFGLLSIYTLLLFIRIIFSWAMVGYRNRLMRFLIDVTEPLLGPLRRVIPPFGRMDISPIFAFLIVWLLQQAVAGTLLRNAPRIPLL
jgi:YggT family protein